MATSELTELGHRPRGRTHVFNYMGGWENKMPCLKPENLEEKIIGEKKSMSLFWDMLSPKAHQGVRCPANKWKHRTGVKGEAKSGGTAEAQEIPKFYKQGCTQREKEVLKNASVRGTRAKEMEETVREGKERFRLLAPRVDQGQSISQGGRCQGRCQGCCG